MPEQRLPRIPNGEPRGRMQAMMLGRSADTALATNPGLNQLIEWISEDKQAHAVTVQLSSPRPINVVPGIDAWVARITWGTAGTHHIADIDFENGTVFSVWASYLRVVAQIDTANGVTAENGQLRATLGHNPHPGSRLPQRTLNVNTEVLAGASTVVDSLPIPFFADSLIVMRDPASGSMLIHVQDGFGVDEYEVSVGAGGMCPLIPLSNRARFIQIDNTSAAAIARMKLIFGLNI